MTNPEISKFNKKSLKSRKRLFIAMQKEDGATVKSSPTKGRFAPVCFVFKNETAYTQHLYCGEEDYFACRADIALLVLDFELAWHGKVFTERSPDLLEIAAYWDAANEVRRREEKSDNAYRKPTTDEVIGARLERGHNQEQAAYTVDTTEARWRQWETINRSMPVPIWWMYLYGRISQRRSISKAADNNAG